MSIERRTRKKMVGKTPDSPNAVSNMVAEIIPVSVNPVENEFDDDAFEPAASDVELSEYTYEDRINVQHADYQTKPVLQKTSKA